MKLEVWHNILWSSYKAGVLSQMALAATARGIDLKVVQIAETEQDRVGLAKVDMSLHRYPMELLFEGCYSAVPLWKMIWAHARRAATTQADMVIIAGFHRPEYIVQAFILWLRRRPRAVFCDSTSYDRPHVWWKSLIKRVSFWLCDYVFCYGQRAQDYVFSFGVPRDHAVLRCQAAALPEGYDVASVAAQRVAQVAPQDAPLFVYVGRLAPEKRLDVLIRAFAKLWPELPGARLRLVGTGPCAEELKALAAELGCAEAVEFPGGQSKEVLYANYAQASCMVLPSWSEPWGLVVNEALHYGCPVIVSDRCGCVPELVENSASGLSVKAGDVDDLVVKMKRGLEIWADPEATALACLHQIAPFTPQNAAAAILDGVADIARRKGRG